MRHLQKRQTVASYKNAARIWNVVGAFEIFHYVINSLTPFVLAHNVSFSLRHVKFVVCNNNNSLQRICLFFSKRSLKIYSKKKHFLSNILYSYQIISDNNKNRTFHRVQQCLTAELCAPVFSVAGNCSHLTVRTHMQPLQV